MRWRFGVSTTRGLTAPPLVFARMTFPETAVWQGVFDGEGDAVTDQGISESSSSSAGSSPVGTQTGLLVPGSPKRARS